ncbi:class I SAM-dependent methyltransferase [Streptosporangium sp. NPDC048865]|uniref:SAM-dependent methyltransferase n=1 Tax=Streptosporangium sp. NPDC048865 TaxID=3155766 RepID=UPI00341F0C54
MRGSLISGLNGDDSGLRAGAGNVRTGPPPSSKIESTYHELAALVNEITGPGRCRGPRAGPRHVAPPPEAVERMTDFVTARLRVGHGSRVLDAGCGHGRPAVRLARTLGAHVVAIDIDREALRDGAGHAAAQGVEKLVRFQCADATALPFADASFDAVLAVEVTPHLDVAAFYRGVARVLRPGGRLVVETPYPHVLADEEVGGRAGPRPATPDAGSLDAPEDHLSAARPAGLAVTELVDITESVRASFFPHSSRPPPFPLTYGPRERGAGPDTGCGPPGTARTPVTFAAWASAAEVGGVVMTFTRTEH